MQQIRVISVICSAAFMLSLIIGCSDNPESKASKDLAADVKLAMDSMINSEKVHVSENDVTSAEYVESHKTARAKIQRSIKANRNASDLSFAYLASGNIALEQAQFMGIKLYEQSKPVNSIVSELSEKISRQKILNLQKTRLTGTIESLNKHAETLKKMIISGDGDLRGIETQLSEIKKRLDNLESRRSSYLDQAQAAQTKGNDLQAEADGLLKQAETAKPAEKLELTKKAYDLLISKKQYYIDYQNAQDMADSLAGEIAIVQPLYTKLAGDMSSLQQKVSEIENSPAKVEIQEELDALAVEAEKVNQKIQWLVGEFKTNKTKYVELHDSITAILDEAVADYQKIRNRNLSTEADFQAARAHGLSGKFSSDAANLFYSLFIKIDILQEAQQQPLDYLDELRQVCELEYKEFTAGGLASYQLSVEEYEKIINGSGGDSYSQDIKESYLLTLYGQMLLADLVQDFDVYDKAEQKAGELIEALKEADAAFSKTVAARLFEGADLTPQLEVDNTAYYESFRKKFQGWKSMSGKQAEAEVTRLLQELEEMQRTPGTDPELLKFLQPDWDELKAAMEKGFEEAAGPGDPNSVF